MIPTPKYAIYLLSSCLLCIIVTQINVVQAIGYNASQTVPTYQATPSSDEPPMLQVVTKVFVPFVMVDEAGRYTGFSIDLWEAIAQEMGVTYELQQVDSVQAMLEQVEQETVDLGIAGITITAQREQRLDFSYPFYSSGLQIMVANNQEHLFGGLLSSTVLMFFAKELLLLVALLVLILIIVAHLIWFVERGNDHEEFPADYRSGIWHSLWWASVTITTVGYGRHVPHTVLGRLIALLWMFIGFFIFAYFTAGVTSSITVQQLANDINSPDDLVGHVIGTVTNTTADNYLIKKRLSSRRFESIDEAYPALEAGEIDAIVYDAPVLQYHAINHGQGKVRVTGLVFEEQDYGIVLPPDSPYREQINLVLLSLIEQGEYQQIYEKWFGS